MRTTLNLSFIGVWLLGANYAAASITTIDFRTLDDIATDVLSVDGLVVTSPDIINVGGGLLKKGGSGLGVGVPDLINPLPAYEHFIDRGESARFAFASGAAVNIGVTLTGHNFFADLDGDGDGIPYEFSVEGFDAMFNSLGSVAFQLGDPRLTVLKADYGLNISSLFGDAPLSSFEFRVDDGFSVNGITFELVDDVNSPAAPEPLSLLVWGGVLACGAGMHKGRGWQRSRRPAPSPRRL